MNDAIKFSNVFFSYDGKTDLFRDLTFSVKKGSLNILIGLNGSGKSTLLKLCSGLLKPKSGKVEIEGINSSNQRRIFDMVSFSFQAPHHQFIHSNVKDELESWGSPISETASLTKKYNLERFYSRSPFTLSEGEKKQLALSCVLTDKRQVILLDEPTLGLDHISKELFLNFLKTIREEYNPTIIITTHDLSFLSLKRAQIYEVAEKAIKQKSIDELLKYGGSFYKVPKHYLFGKRLEKALQIIPKGQAKLFRDKFELLVAELEGKK
ncbi:MAG: energy-coupling factor ABC transporter ATP-binding protein [Candidatus Kariarchaeaceae archaeon]